MLLYDLRQWLGPVHVFLTGGEALLRPYTTDVVAYGSAIGLAVEVLTHGYWKDQTRIEELASANPWRVTLSVDGVGETHSRIRGRHDFWNWTSQSINTLQRERKEKHLTYEIRLKSVIMAQNVDSAIDMAHFAADNHLSVFYQPIEQNYNTPEDLRWFENASTWPKDPNKAVEVVEQLIVLKRRGLPIANSYRQLEVMVPYFRDPTSTQKAVESHSAHENRQLCSALNMLEFRPNGDVLICSRKPAIGNFLKRPIREIWRERPRWWKQGCCQSQYSGMLAKGESVSAVRTTTQ
jgi:MoaA/NifB/PqqE/SkfB family radical SAM enzyme